MIHEFTHSIAPVRLRILPLASGCASTGELGIFSGQGGWSHEAIVISDQLQIQLTAVVATAAYTALATFVILKIVDVVTGLRVDSQTETQGLDLDSHGETGYNL